jgi:hypothetical protein
MRTIKFKLLTQVELVSIETNAATFGELKSEDAVKRLEIDWTSSKLIGKTSKVSYDLNESVLQQSDTIFFVTPTKTKSGLGYKEARAEVQRLIAEGVISPINFVGKSNKDLHEIIANSGSSEIKVTVSTPGATNESSTTNEDLISEVVELLENAKKKLQLVSFVSNDSTFIKELTLFKESLVEYVTTDELQQEALELAKKF